MNKGEWITKIKEETDKMTLKNLISGLQNSHFKHMPKFGSCIVAQKIA